MYWNNNSVSSSHLETLLSKEDVTLQELMDEEEVLQECKSQNRRLIDYLIRSDVLEELVTLTTVEPAGDDYSKYKYPNIACELLTCEVPQLNERLVNDEALMGKLYSFLESNAPLNPLLASFFSKTFSVLIGRSSEQNWYSYQLTCLQVLEFLKSKENCVALLLKHLGTSAIMDLLFKLITAVEHEVKANMLNWLDDQKLVQNLVKLFDPSISSDVHNNAAQLLCDVIRTSRENSNQANEQDRILDRIESPETVSLLLDQILQEPKCETSIIGGISVLLTLLEDEKRDANEAKYNLYSNLDTKDTKEPSKVVLSTIKAILPRLKDFHDILLNPPVKPAVSTTIGVLDPPLGNTRVEVAKLLSVLVANNNFEINKELAELDTINVLLDLFFKYTWNNFLHTQVEHCLAFALNSDISVTEGSETPNNFLIAHIFDKCRLLQRILDAWDDNEKQQNVHKRPRRGYMGHLIKIANLIAAKGPLGALLSEVVDSETLSKWKNFLATNLAAINITYSTYLGGVHPQEISEESKLQEALAVSCPQQFGSYQEEQFNDDEELHNSSSDLILQKISFNMNEDDLDQQSASFEEVCDEDYPILGDDKIELFVKDLKTAIGNRLTSIYPENPENSSSDEDEPPERSGPDGREDNGEEFDTICAWPSEGDNVPAPVATVNPWDSTTIASNTNLNSSTSPDMGWANFESAPFVADFSLNLTPEIKTTIATSVSSEIDTIPLDLTPSDSNPNVDEMFSKCESQMESAQIVENNPQKAVFTDIESITDTFNDLVLNNEKSEEGKVPLEGETEATGTTECVSGDTVVSAEDSQVNSLQNQDLIGDINSSEAKNENNLGDNVRLHSPQGLMTKYGQVESESSGDGYKLLQENVQSVPNDSNQSR
ncbi:UNVERIFIED_CONTAM: hypothetical protein PYX00_001563 [Menopon gallinae]|uniref:Serine/threonine-protein phosphatase 6 regulatory subunit 3 n=1 Tax=Menopon gallinae TaxID=328185 RepID=A0AAW2IE87_9NEOP